MNESDIEDVLAANRIAWGRLVPVPPPEKAVYGVNLTEEEPHRLWRSLRTEVVFEDSPDRIARLEAERAELEGFARRCQLVHQSARDDYEDVLAAKDARIAALKADNVSLTEELGAAHKVIAWLERKLAAFTAFTDDPTDLPDPPRRPDGTLMPQPKALTLPRETGDKRRVGS